MDEVDRKILSILKEDGRRSYVEVGKHVNLSEAAVRRRVQNLVDKGIIKRFTIEVEEPQGASAITFVSVAPATPTSEVSAKLKNIKGVEVVYETTGEHDISAIISGANIAEINKTIDDVRRVPGVSGTNTAIILRVFR